MIFFYLLLFFVYQVVHYYGLKIETLMYFASIIFSILYSTFILYFFKFPVCYFALLGKPPLLVKAGGKHGAILPLKDLYQPL